MLLPKDILTDMEHASTKEKIAKKVREYMEEDNFIHPGAALLDIFERNQMTMVTSMATMVSSAW